MDFYQNGQVLHCPARLTALYSATMRFDQQAIDILRQTSRTFFVPIIRMPRVLRDAVGSAYLCMRAIDEIEDHPDLPKEEKIDLLEQISAVLRTNASRTDEAYFQTLFTPYGNRLPQVTRSIGHYALMAPGYIADTVWEATSAMAHAMADWVQRDFMICTEADLDQYTFDVAGRVGLLLTDIWHWHDGENADRDLAIGFGRGLQAVNIVRNREEDLARGADFFPEGWERADMIRYVRRQLTLADAYMDSLNSKPAQTFCRIPLSLAYGTLEALEAGREKLSRDEVEALVGEAGG